MLTLQMTQSKENFENLSLPSRHMPSVNKESEIFSSSIRLRDHKLKKKF